MGITTTKHIKTLRVNALILMKNFKWKKALKSMTAIIEIKTKNIKPHTFLDISKQLSHKQKTVEAIQVLKEGLQKYPENIKIRKELAYLYFKEKKWHEVSDHLTIAVQDFKAKLTAADYAKLGKSFRVQEKFEEAENFLTTGLSLFPNNKAISIELAEIEMARKNWVRASSMWKCIIETYSSKTPAHVFLRLGIAYRRMKSFNASEDALLQGMSHYPNHAKLNREYAQSSILQKNWDEAIRRLELITEKFDGDTQLKSKFDLGILNEIQGNSKEAEKYYDYCYTQKTDEMPTLYSSGYRKITIFDNGESRIEYYKKLSKVNTLCITFDSINIVWSRTPFGYDFLKKQNIDIMAVRRRKSTSYQQDLSFEDFYGAVHRFIEKYKRTVSYGFSLGAYSALYYGSEISNQVLAISPRNPGHPVYGIKHNHPVEFNHPLSHDLNPDVSPIIIYDPKNIIDSNYIEEDLLKSYPASLLIKCPYVGHNTAKYFSQIGILKKFILSVLNDEELPEIDKKQRINSQLYLSSLGRFCLKRNKPNWALKLVNHILEMKPEDEVATILKTKVVKELENNKHV